MYAIINGYFLVYCVAGGRRNIPIVGECKCVDGCQRLPHLQEVTVYRENATQGQGEGWSGDAIGQGEMETYQTMIDIGKCTGTCPPPEQKCIS